MILFSGSECKELGEHIARKAELEFGMLKIKKFPDNEIYVRILTEVENKDCVVVQSTTSNDALIELLFILDTLKDLKARTIHALIPYLGYARQDKRFLSGEAITAKTVLEMINSRADEITTVNAHFFDEIGKQIYDGIELNNLSAFPVLTDYLKDKVKKPVLIAPDKGALGYVENAAKIFKLKYEYIEKERISDDEVEMKVKNLDFVSRKDVILLDDIISTGGTMVKATEMLISQGARSVNIGVVHGALVEGLDKVSEVADNVICTNSIFREKYSKVSLSGLIGKFLKEEN